MRRLLSVFCCLCIAAPALAAQGPVVSGTVVESGSNRPLAGVTVQLSPNENPSQRLTVTTGDDGRFRLSIVQRGSYAIVARSPGFTPSGLTIRVESDSLSVAITLVRLAQSLPEVSIVESELDLFVRDLRQSYKSVNRSRVYDAAQMEKTRQLLAGSFLLGQGGVVAVPCQRSSQFLPEGKARTEPVTKEPADIWYPCFLDRGKPRSIMIRVDGGPAEPFDAIGNRVLSEFAAVAIVQGGLIVAYTKDYAMRQRRRSR